MSDAITRQGVEIFSQNAASSFFSMRLCVWWCESVDCLLNTSFRGMMIQRKLAVIGYDRIPCTSSWVTQTWSRKAEKLKPGPFRDLPPVNQVLIKKYFSTACKQLIGSSNTEKLTCIRLLSQFYPRKMTSVKKLAYCCLQAKACFQLFLQFCSAELWFTTSIEKLHLKTQKYVKKLFFSRKVDIYSLPAMSSFFACSNCWPKLFLLKVLQC